MHLNRNFRKWGHSYTNQEKMGQSYTVFLEKGSYRIPSSAEKGGYSGRTSVQDISAKRKKINLQLNVLTYAAIA